MLKKKEDVNALVLIVFLYLKYLIACLSLFYLTNYSTSIAALITIFLFLWVLKRNRFIFNLNFITLFCIITIFYLLNAIVVSYSNEVIKVLFNFISYNLILMYIISREVNYDKLLKYWYIVAKYTTILTGFSYFIGSYKIAGYMFIGIYLAYNFIIIFFNLINSETRKSLNLLLALIIVGITLTSGNKGSIITILISIPSITYISTRSTVKKVIICLLTLISTTIIINSVDVLIILFEKLADILGSKGTSLLRWIYFFKNGFEGGSAGRDILFEQGIDIIRNSYGLPRGIGYYKYITGWDYPHNLLLDIFIVFGPLIGAFLIFIIIFKTIIYFKNNKDDKSKIIFFCLIFIFFITRTLTSSSFIIERSFWILIFLTFLKSSYKVKNKTG